MNPRSILSPDFTIPGQWTPPQPRSEIEAMLAVPMTTRRYVRCLFCGLPVEGLHRCPAMQADPVNDDRRDRKVPTPEQIRTCE